MRLCASDGVVATVDLEWSYPGEVKDVEVRFANGRRLAADMLAGHAGFKQSLWHEYVGVLGDFAYALSQNGAARTDGGLPALRLEQDAYTAAEESKLHRCSAAEVTG